MRPGAGSGPGLRGWHRLARCGLLALALVAPSAGAWGQGFCVTSFQSVENRPLGTAENPSHLGGLSCVRYFDGTERYPHGVLGDTREPTTLSGAFNGIGLRLILDEAHVFEDLAPRLADLDFDGVGEIITIRSHQTQGAQLAIYAPDPENATFQLIASTPYIGRRNRWLAPIGVADFNGDGQMDIAYIDRPHLARTLRVWSFVPGGLAGTGNLREIASASGLTNHRIGEDFITGGVRDCGQGPEMITADTNWSQVIATWLTPDNQLQARALGPFSQAAVAAALDCR